MSGITKVTETLEVSLWRGAAQGRYETYLVPRRESQTVLDVVTFVQRHLDPTLSYRFACRVGMCGSCAMTVNGRPRWTCRTHVAKVAPAGRLTIGPLENLPVIKDLATDMQPFFEKWQQAKGAFVPSRTRHDAIERIRPDGKARTFADAAIECINCGVCYAACDTVRWNEAYLGPAALNRAWSLVNDQRDGGKSRATAGGGGLRRLPRLPLASVLPGALPAGTQSDRVHSRSQAPRRAGLPQGRAMTVRLYVWQRLTAALMVPLIVLHVAIIFYATRKGLTAADILSRTRGSLFWGSLYGAFVAAAAIHAGIGVRTVLTEWSAARRARCRPVRGGIRDPAAGARPAGGGGGGAAVTARRRLEHRRSVLWVAALVHRLSGLALAIFLPLHFLALGLAIDGEARLERFLRWSDQLPVKLAEAGLVFLVLVHMLGGVRLLVIENLDWSDGQKQLATIAAGISAVVAFVFLAAYVLRIS